MITPRENSYACVGLQMSYSKQRRFRREAWGISEFTKLTAEADETLSDFLSEDVTTRQKHNTYFTEPDQ